MSKTTQRTQDEERKTSKQSVGQSIVGGANAKKAGPTGSLPEKKGPTQTEIENFLYQLNYDSIKGIGNALLDAIPSNATSIGYKEFKEQMDKHFRSKPLHEPMKQALYNRFRPLKINNSKYNETQTADLMTEMDVLDFLLGINCLSRCGIETKIKIMFELCDSDDDGCMNPQQILQMLQKVERVFSRETSRIDIKSTVLLNSMADKRAEKNFHFIMTTIRQQAINKLFKEQLKDARAEEVKKNGGKPVPMREMKRKMQANAPPIDMTQVSFDLITYKEFMSALKDLKEELFYKILPRSLSFAEVLGSAPSEPEYTVSDLNLDDFLMFRYELQTLSKKHMFQDEEQNELFMLGKNPLSKYQGQPVKEVLRDLKRSEVYKSRENEKEEIMKKCQEIYQIPGLVSVAHSGLNKMSTLPSDIKQCIPSDVIYTRKKDDQQPTAKPVPQKFGNTLTVGAATTNLKKQTTKADASQAVTKGVTIGSTAAPADQATLNALFKKHQLDVQLDKESANTLDFQKLYQFNLPPEALDLKVFVERFKEKDLGAECDPQALIAGAYVRLHKMQNLVPQSDGIKISAKMMLVD